MSSHHFVTDRQSTALFICGDAIATELLMELLEWNAFVISTAEQVAWLNSLRIRIDMVIDSNEDLIRSLPYDVEAVTGASGPILKQLIDQGRAGRVVVVGVNPDSEQYRHSDISPKAWFYRDQKWVRLDEGQHYAKWLPEGRRLGLHGGNYRIFEGQCRVDKDTLIVEQDGWIKIIADNELFIAEFF